MCVFPAVEHTTMQWAPLSEYTRLDGLFPILLHYIHPTAGPVQLGLLGQGMDLRLTPPQRPRLASVVLPPATEGASGVWGVHPPGAHPLPQWSPPCTVCPLAIIERSETREVYYMVPVCLAKFSHTVWGVLKQKCTSGVSVTVGCPRLYRPIWTKDCVSDDDTQ